MCRRYSTGNARGNDATRSELMWAAETFLSIAGRSGDVFIQRDLKLGELFGVHGRRTLLRDAEVAKQKRVNRFWEARDSPGHRLQACPIGFRVPTREDANRVIYDMTRFRTLSYGSSGVGCERSADRVS